ncbi:MULTISPECIES: YagK/YfjJ domain-containing protein [Psychrobacter]|uniref:YagK/YfjJ domain-containing protein n=1 Tax=Psychrobacter TaxID=497 RepID=UPI0008A6B8BF|nr:MULTISPECIES: inovirus-type Gp2 protein [Psychrobacter]AOY45180.1 hypothetical protein AOT82_2801 [Psychrobacter sp. AntiMn-1]AOY45204.1 hypothetical protein AOT82_2825 [Psychrobacter sp. AntiMn-1]
MTVSNLNFSQLLCQADRLVKYILHQRISISKVSIYLTELYLPILYNFDFELCYPETVKAFIGSGYVAAEWYLPEELIWDNSRTLYFINLIHENYKLAVIDYEKQFQKQKQDNRLSLKGYLSCIFDHYAKLLVVRVDLGYLKEKIDKVDIYEFNDHVSNLRDLISNKKTCFEHLEGHAWAIEQGFDRGFHCHLLLIYQGNKRQKDTYLGQRVGEKWQEITGGLGSYFNCNDPAHKKRFTRNERLGLGMVHRDSQVNDVTAENAISTALYLADPSKLDQALKIRVRGMRTFGHGQYRTANRRGLPPIAK